MSQVANVFKDGAAVIIKATATKPNGDALKQAGKPGTVVSIPKPGRYMVDVPGFPLVNLAGEDLDHPAAVSGATDVNVVTDVVAKGDTPNTPVPAAPAPADLMYGFEVALLTSIVPSRTNPRIYFDPEALQSLSDNIAEDGILQPLLLRLLPVGRLGEDFSAYPGRTKATIAPIYEIVAGERRFRASVMAGVRSVPVLIRVLTDEQVLRMQLIENVQRKDLHPLEEAQGYRQILDLESQAGKTMAQRQEELAGSIKRSVRYVYQTLQLLHLCDFSKKIFLEGKLQRTTALEVAKIGNEAGQIEATREIAGLGRNGTEVTDDPLSHREAVRYVRDNHQLVLNKAPFPIKVALADAPACGECPKMSANARELFDEGAKGPDTCLDRSCYGRKSAAHSQAIADGAKAKGQQVITGAAAKKILPYYYKTDELEAGFVGLDEKQYGNGLNGKTVRQILGKDLPLPVLVENPHESGFVEAIAEAELKRIFKERGIGSASDVGVGKYKQDARNDEKKDKAERAWRWAYAETLLIGCGHTGGNDERLLCDLFVPMLIQLYRRLDNECTKRTHKLMKWDFAPIGYNEHAKLKKHFEALAGHELCQFVMCAIVTSELHVAQYYKPSTVGLDAMADLVKVDGKALKATMQAEARQVEKDKAAKLKANAEKAAKKTVKPTAAASAAEFSAGQRVRFKQGLKGPAGHFRKCCGKAGVISSILGRQIFVKLDGSKETTSAERQELEGIESEKPSNKTQWRDITSGELATLQPGPRVRVKSMAALGKTKKLYTGLVGTLKSKIGPAAWFVDFTVPGKKGEGEPVSFHVDELQLEVIDPAAPVAGATAPTAPAAKKAAPKKAAAADKQGSLDLPAPSKAIDPMKAWPFPTKARP